MLIILLRPVAAANDVTSLIRVLSETLRFARNSFIHSLPSLIWRNFSARLNKARSPPAGESRIHPSDCPPSLSLSSSLPQAETCQSVPVELRWNVMRWRRMAAGKRERERERGCARLSLVINEIKLSERRHRGADRIAAGRISRAGAICRLLLI